MSYAFNIEERDADKEDSQWNNILNHIEFFENKKDW